MSLPIQHNFWNSSFSTSLNGLGNKAKWLVIKWQLEKIEKLPLLLQAQKAAELRVRVVESFRWRRLSRGMKSRLRCLLHRLTYLAGIRFCWFVEVTKYLTIPQLLMAIQAAPLLSETILRIYARKIENNQIPLSQLGYDNLQYFEFLLNNYNPLKYLDLRSSWQMNRKPFALEDHQLLQIVQRRPYLTHLCLNSDEITNFGPILQLSHLEYLDFSSETITNIPTLSKLSALRSLRLDSCHQLLSLPELRLPQLCELHICECDNLEALPRLHLPKLTSMNIKFCYSLSFFSPSVDLPILKELSLSGNSHFTQIAVDKILDMLSTRPDKMQRLDVSALPLEDSDFLSIATLCPSLTHLAIGGAFLTNAGACYLLCFTQLEMLSLNTLGVTKLPPLQQLSTLTSLTCNYGVSEECMIWPLTSPMGKRLLQLTIFPSISNGSLEKIVAVCSQLQSLTVKCDEITSGLSYLSNLKNLHTLSLTCISCALLPGHDTLQQLYLNFNTRFPLPMHLPSLAFLSLSNPWHYPIGEELLKQLFPNLKTLQIHRLGD